jgi:hypothetical protein
MNEAVAAWSDEEYVKALKALKAIEDVKRRTKLPFFRKLIYDLTGYDIESIDYLESRELIVVKFMNPFKEDLIINIHLDSIEACTRDVIRQTINYVERND